MVGGGDDDGTWAREHYSRLFRRVVEQTLRRIHPGDRGDVVDETILAHHLLQREGKSIHEFPCRVRSYAERDFLEQELIDRSAVDRFWQQGAGLAMSICGYGTQSVVMVQFKHVAYLEVYGRIQPLSFLCPSIIFDCSQRDVTSFENRLYRGLALMDGCRFGTIEVLWKYYRAVVAAHSRNRARQERQERQTATVTAGVRNARAAVTPAGRLTPLGAVAAVTPAEADSAIMSTGDKNPGTVLSPFLFELTDESIDEFGSAVDGYYRTSFDREYNSFSYADGYLLDRRCINAMYLLMFRLFPLIHGVFAMIVSSRSGVMLVPVERR